MDSELAWGPGQRVQSVVLSVRREGAAGPLRDVRTTVLGADGERRPLPLLVGVNAGIDLQTPVWIEALGCGGPNGCTAATAVVAQRAVVRFTRGETQEVSLLLASACVGVRCAREQRCAVDSGRCEAATRAQEMVRPFSGSDAATVAVIDAREDVQVIADQPVATDAPMRGDSGIDMDVPADRIEPMDHGVVLDAPMDAAPRDGGPADVVAPDTGPMDSGSGDGGPHPPCPAGLRLIPAGMFLMGEPGSDDAPAQPVHGVRLTAFCMDETEVTVSAYAECVRLGACTSPGTGTFCNWMIPGREQHPVNCIDWNQARSYCQSRGSELPTEAQWEYAARGTDGRAYPWGNDAPSSQPCWIGGGQTRTSTCATRSFSSGVSPFGLFDMAGNVFEWTLDWMAPYTGDVSSSVMNPVGPAGGTSRVLRGGPWNTASAIIIRSTHRDSITPTYRSGDTGFRCAHAP
ncbi:MAG: hypothetical protein EPO40_24055 [Myxococcaceae bacterium]|nr:MAG: hypothetical protein EPO40_24055 [Myxococcaceae bacterium]